MLHRKIVCAHARRPSIRPLFGNPLLNGFLRNKIGHAKVTFKLDRNFTAIGFNQSRIAPTNYVVVFMEYVFWKFFTSLGARPPDVATGMFESELED